MWVAAACSGISPYVTHEQLSLALRTFAETVADHRVSNNEERELLLKVADHVVTVEESRRAALISGRTILAALQGNTTDGTA